MNCSISKRARGFGIIVTAKDCDGNLVDISLATYVAISFRHKNTVLNGTASFVTDGIDGQVVFVTSTNTEYFDSIGNWIVEIVATFPDGTYPSTTTNITVTS